MPFRAGHDGGLALDEGSEDHNGTSGLEHRPVWSGSKAFGAAKGEYLGETEDVVDPGVWGCGDIELRAIVRYVIWHANGGPYLK